MAMKQHIFNKQNFTTSDMAKASFRSPTPSLASSLSAPVSISHHITCSICMDVLWDPVTTSCGHTFCKMCLERNMSYSDYGCPLCKQHLPGRPSINIVLKAILEEYKEAQKPVQNKFTGVAGEVVCDICPKQHKCKAVKSCLMCLLSYCTEHLEMHQSKSRLNGHKLVAPVENLDDRACLPHGRPLELFLPEEKKCICSLCVKEETQVLSLESERSRREEEMKSIIKDLEQRIQQREEKVKEFEHSAENCLALIEREQEEIKDVFDAVRKALAKAEEEALSPLKEKKRSVEREVKELKEELQSEVLTFSKSISDIKKIIKEEDHILFLQSYPSIPASDNGKDWTNTALDTNLTFGTLRDTRTSMMADIETEMEKLCSIEIERIKKFAVVVTLDEDTASAQLLVSDDGKEVRHFGESRDVPDSPERFDMFGCVLGHNRLTEGRAFWVIDVRDKQGWDIGVAREEANRRGKLSLKPSQGYWAIVLYNRDQYASLEDPPILLSLEDKPRKVGVFVDYQERLISFYDVEAKSHIYSFTDCEFNGVVRPYFSPHLSQASKNSSPLIICPVDHSD